MLLRNSHLTLAEERSSCFIFLTYLHILLTYYLTYSWHTLGILLSYPCRGKFKLPSWFMLAIAHIVLWAGNLFALCSGTSYFIAFAPFSLLGLPFSPPIPIFFSFYLLTYYADIFLHISCFLSLK